MYIYIYYIIIYPRLYPTKCIYIYYHYISHYIPLNVYIYIYYIIIYPRLYPTKCIYMYIYILYHYISHYIPLNIYIYYIIIYPRLYPNKILGIFGSSPTAQLWGQVWLCATFARLAAWRCEAGQKMRQRSGLGSEN